MNYLDLDPTLLHLGLRAIKAVTLADGHFDDHERRLLAAIARALHIEADPDTLVPIYPEELPAQLPDPVWRERVVQAQIIAALIDGQLDETEAKMISEFARALDVDEPRIHNLKQLLSGHALLLQLDLSRKSRMFSDVAQAAWQTEGVKGLWKTWGGIAGIATDAALAKRYAALGQLPENTLGRQYHDHMRERGFPLPGEREGFPELLVKHDACHILGDYDTDTQGECEVVAFIAGFMKTDPFWYLFMIAVQMHLGVKTFRDASAADTMKFDPDLVVSALARGAEVNRDLYATDFDWWPWLQLPVDEVRAAFNVRPKADFR